MPSVVARRYLPVAVFVLLLLAIWQGAAQLFNISPSVLPTPVRIASAVVDNWPTLWDNTLQTLLETGLGFGVALAGGFGLAVLLDGSPVVKRAVYPVLVASQTVPLVAIAPLLIVWLGFDIWPKIIIVWLVCFFPITVGGVDGFASTDPETIKLFRSLNASWWQIFWHLKWPSALPNLFSGSRIAITYSVGGAILGEYVGADKGLGRLISLYARSFNRDLVFAVVFMTAATTIILFILLNLLERRAMGWYFAMREKKY